MIKSIYTYIRIFLSIIPFAFLIPFEFLMRYKHYITYPFFAVTLIFSLSIPLKRLLKEGSFTVFEAKLNYFLDEFFVYGAVILLSQYKMAPLWIVIIYFFKDATIGAIRNFAIQNDVELNERFGYKIDKFIQYCVILFVSYNMICSHALIMVNFDGILGCVDSSSIDHGYIQKQFIMFYVSAAVSALTLIVFFFLNKDFMKKIHNS